MSGLSFYSRKKPGSIQNSNGSSRPSKNLSKTVCASGNRHQTSTGESVTPRRKKIALRSRNECQAVHYQPGMPLGGIAAQFTMGVDNSSDSEGLYSDEEDDVLDYPLDGRLAESRNNGQFEQHMSPFSTPPSGHQSIILMLQKQQAMLQEVLSGQKALEDRQNTVESHLAELQSKVEKSAVSTPTSSSSEGKRKRIVTRTLSVSIFLGYWVVP